jgi:hypothetical protein
VVSVVNAALNQHDLAARTRENSLHHSVIYDWIQYQ